MSLYDERERREERKVRVKATEYEEEVVVEREEGESSRVACGRGLDVNPRQLPKEGQTQKSGRPTKGE